MFEQTPSAESVQIEFKRELPAKATLAKTIVAFCNTFGGELFIGVQDDGTVCGIDADEAASLVERLPKTIFDSITPPVLPRIRVVPVGERYVVVLTVSPGTQRPYFISSDGLDKGCYIRVGSSSVRATPPLIMELQWAGRGLTPDSIPVYGSTEHDLDSDAFRRFLHTRRPSVPSADIGKYLREYRLVSDEHGASYPTRAGILLFGKDPQRSLTESFVMASHFKGVSGREALASLDCMGTVPAQLMLVEEFISNRLARSFKISGLKRSEEHELPAVAIREILVNALVHRDYALPGSTKVALFEDRLEFFSPGAFPGPIALEDLQHGVSYIRNPIIARVMREMGFMEKLGSGFVTVYRALREQGLADPEVIGGGSFVKVVFFRRQAEHTATNDAEKITHLLHRRGSATIADIQQTVGGSRASALRLLRALVEEGKVVRQGKGRATRYTHGTK